MISSDSHVLCVKAVALMPFPSCNILHSLKHLLKSFVKFMKQKWWVESRGRESKLLISKKSKTQGQLQI